MGHKINTTSPTMHIPAIGKRAQKCTIKNLVILNNPQKVVSENMSLNRNRVFKKKNF